MHKKYRLIMEEEKVMQFLELYPEFIDRCNIVMGMLKNLTIYRERTQWITTFYIDKYDPSLVYGIGYNYKESYEDRIIFPVKFLYSSLEEIDKYVEDENKKERIRQENYKKAVEKAKEEQDRKLYEELKRKFES